VVNAEGMAKKGWHDSLRLQRQYHQPSQRGLEAQGQCIGPFEIGCFAKRRDIDRDEGMM